MKIILAGSSEYAIPALEELLACPEHDIVLVLSQPARPKGRKQLLEDTPLALCAKQNSLPVFCPADVNSAESLNFILSHDAEVLVTASYGLFLGRRLRQGYPLGAINLHPSLLPRYRGPSPIRGALLNGDTVSGTSIFRLVAKMDAGPILLQEELQIKANENYSSLHDRLANQAATLLLKLLPKLHHAQALPQEHEAATFTKMIQKADLSLDFSRDSKSLVQQIRAYSLDPGAYMMFRGTKLKILEAKALKISSDLPAGSISQIIKNEGFAIATGDGQLLVSKVQAAGKRLMDAWAYHLGARLQIGERSGL
jgi:methionyl-tRNA formyltransferase